MSDGIKYGCYARLSNPGEPNCSVDIMDCGNVTGFTVFPHSNGLFLGGASTVVGGGINEFEVIGPGTDHPFTIRVEYVKEHYLTLRCERADIAGTYVRLLA